MPLALLGVIAVLFGSFVAISNGAASVPTPTITAAPANPTNELSATFSFTNGLLPGLLGSLSYQCSLDGATFTACTSPKTYSSLATGSHTFQVRAKRSSGELSTAASHTWVIDRTAPPAPQITSKPASLSTDANPSFAFTDAEAGVSYRCKLDGGSFTDCSNPKTYSSAGQGAHTFSVAAVDPAGNVSAAVSYAWVLDSVAPSKPKITDGPASVTTASKATFTFTDSDSGVSFECRRDDGGWSACASPLTYLHLVAGKHDFYVRAVDVAGNRSNDDTYSWKITQEASRSFSMSGNLVGLLHPGGPARPVAVKLTNPNSDAIYVTSLQVTVTGTSTAACAASTNLAVTQSPLSQDSYVLVPGNGSVTLPAQGVAAPTIRMLNLPVNQNACKNATFTLGYSGSAHS
jgi:hypothetical protein